MNKLEEIIRCTLTTRNLFCLTIWWFIFSLTRHHLYWLIIMSNHPVNSFVLFWRFLLIHSCTPLIKCCHFETAVVDRFYWKFLTCLYFPFFRLLWIVFKPKLFQVHQRIRNKNILKSFVQNLIYVIALWGWIFLVAEKRASVSSYNSRLRSVLETAAAKHEYEYRDDQWVFRYYYYFTVILMSN